MVKGLKNLSERAMPQSTYYLISIGNRISSADFGFASGAGEVLDGMYPSGPNIKDFIPAYFFLFEGS